jgi:hypothetical protein
MISRRDFSLGLGGDRQSCGLCGKSPFIGNQWRGVARRRRRHADHRVRPAMNLDHVTLRTTDLEGTRSFLESVLDLKPGYPVGG